MASQSLHRKWRSQKFGELLGQEPIIRTLKNALSSGKPAHAYLFTGPRGTGKTSTARLLAKTINCVNSKEGEPCNLCQQCREITAGNSFNVIEIDAASNRGIDSIRELREKVMMPPATGKYKVYVLDEAHMLTPEAFNALLKTLEEPPSYVIFVLATTDVHKMLPTVLSRCQRFDFKRITTRQIIEHLNFVAEQEHVKLERAAAELIARAAAGGMRDALSLLDQAIAYAGEEIALAQVQMMLGVADPQAIHKLVMYVAQLDSSGGLHLLHELSEAGADLRQINTQVVEYWRALMLARAGADVAAILDLPEDETREVKQTAQLFLIEELTECARIFAQNDLMQKNQGTPQLGLELAFLESVELHRRPQASLAPAVVAVSAQQVRPAPTQGPSRSVASQPVSAMPDAQTPTSSETRSSSPSASPKEALEAAPKAVDTLPDWDDLPSSDEEMAPLESSPAPKEIPTVPTDDTGLSSLTVQQVKDAWDNIKKRTKQKNGLVAATLSHCKILAIEGTSAEPIVVLQIASDAHYKIVNARTKDVEWALTMEFGQPCRVRLEKPGKTAPPALFSETSNYATNGAATMTQASAHRERPPIMPAPIPPEPSEQAEQEAPTQRVQEERPSYIGSSDVTPLARTELVSEYTAVVSPQETLEQKARRDPVVQEVMKLFVARIVHVQPK